jgi:hypothetical protein
MRSDFALPPKAERPKVVISCPRAKPCATSALPVLPVAPKTNNRIDAHYTLGYAVSRVKAEFPDCDAFRELGPNKWQPLRIEFEYESRNFLLHKHPVLGCDLIVCWKHNWPECPLEVLELEKVVMALPLRNGYSG